MTTRSSDQTSTIIWPLMKGFIDLVGVGAGIIAGNNNENEDAINEIASYLLRDAGKFPNDYNAKANDQDWKLTNTS